MTSCDEIRISLGALAVGRWTPTRNERVREHVADCRTCAAGAGRVVGRLLTCWRQRSHWVCQRPSSRIARVLEGCSGRSVKNADGPPTPVCADAWPLPPSVQCWPGSRSCSSRTTSPAAVCGS